MNKWKAMNLVVIHQYHPISSNPNVLMIELLIGINMGGKLLPQGAVCDVISLTIATRNKEEKFTYEWLTRDGALFTPIYVVLGFAYLAISALII